MDWKKYKSAVAAANYSSTVWMGIAVFMLLVNSALAYKVLTMDTSEKTIVTPMTLSRPFTVQGDSISDSYYEQMAKYFSNELLTYQKSNARARFEGVLKYVDPLVYNEMRGRFMMEADRIQRANISSVFHPTKLRIKSGTAYITGEQLGMIGESVVSRGEKTYSMGMSYEDSALTITGFNEVRQTPTGEYEVIDPYKEVLISAGDDRPAVITPANEESASDVTN